MTRKEMELSYEVEKLKVKLNLASDIAKKIDKKIFEMVINRKSDDIKEMVEQANGIRDKLRDFSDFLKESKEGVSYDRS